MNKKYVKVTVEIDENGKKQPLTIDFDGKIFNIDKVLDCRPAVSMKVGGLGDRYTVRICRHETYLFNERNKWFVEEK